MSKKKQHPVLQWLHSERNHVLQPLSVLTEILVYERRLVSTFNVVRLVLLNLYECFPFLVAVMFSESASHPSSPPPCLSVPQIIQPDSSPQLSPSPWQLVSNPLPPPPHPCVPTPMDYFRMPNPNPSSQPLPLQFYSIPGATGMPSSPADYFYMPITEMYEAPTSSPPSTPTDDLYSIASNDASNSRNCSRSHSAYFFHQTALGLPKKLLQDAQGQSLPTFLSHNTRDPPSV